MTLPRGLLFLTKRHVPYEYIQIRDQRIDKVGLCKMPPNIGSRLPIDFPVNVKAYLADLFDKGLLDPNYRLLLDHKFSGTRTISRGLISKMVFNT